MGCASCTEICGNQKDTLKINNEFLQIAREKVMFLRKAFSKPEQKKILDQFLSQQQMNIILHLMSLQQTLRSQNILLPEAGQLAYLSPTRRTLWKLYAFDSLVYEYSKNTIVPQFYEDLSQVKLSEKAQQRFYQINLDINRTFPLTKHLNRERLSLVLKNLTLYFDGVGYTQGMNFVVGFLLLCGFNPKETYWMFIHLSYNQNFLLIRNFSEGFKNVLFMIKVFEGFMESNVKLKNIKSKVDEMGLTSFFYSFSWFLCYFLYSLEPKSCVLIWDYVLTFDSRKIGSIQKNEADLSKQPKSAIHEQSQLQIQLTRRHKSYPQYFTIIQSHRGSILNLIHLSFQLMQYLSQHINQTESPQELMKVLRNQSLIEKITPEIVSMMIERIKRGDTLEEIDENHDQNGKERLDWKYLVDMMKKDDPELFGIEVREEENVKFVEDCLGLRRSVDSQVQKIKVQSKK